VTKLLVALLAATLAFSQAQKHTAQTVEIRVLSTMLASAGLGEWGFSAVVDVDGRRILFDTGARPDTVLQNARELHVDLSNVTDVILSHNHPDHTGGLLTLRRDVMQKNPAALTRAHAGKGIALERPGGWIARMKKDYEAAGGTLIEHDRPVELLPGVWLTGPVPRVHRERNWTGNLRVLTAEGSIEDNIPEDMSLVIVTGRGLILLSGCGHSGIVNTLEYTRKSISPEHVHAAIGGFHLYEASDATLAWTAEKLRGFGVEYFLGAHCTGIEVTHKLRELLGLKRDTAAVAAVGARFKLGAPMDPGPIAR
jgi:7,8-dihydropterin-6-yl-methyl-4-(beta-D-ribofuranosyl)aminobenzene 5'-phosphate synthase